METTPRVRTLEESMNLPDNAISWIEVKKGTDTATAYSMFPPGIRESVLWPEEYGVKWRVWEGKPTKEQRNAVPWKREA